MIVEHGDFELDDDPKRVDRDLVWAFLSTEAYWGRSRDRELIERQLDYSWRMVGAYDRHSGAMVGFARAVSDGARTAYLADVFVFSDVRGKGLGTQLVHTMIELGPGADFRWMLHTMDAHGLYERFGFARPDEKYLERPARNR